MKPAALLRATPRLTIEQRLTIADALDAAEKALEFYAKDHEWPDDGPWGINSNDYGDVARDALPKLRGQE